MKFDYTRSMKIDTVKKTKTSDEARYIVQLFERYEDEDNYRRAELNRLRHRLAMTSSGSEELQLY